MPNFVTNAGEEVYVSPARPVFRRGKRLDEHTIRRIRDIWCCVLASLGCDSSDISSIISSGVTDRQVRNRVHKNMPLDIRRSIEDMAVEVIAAARKRVPPAPPSRTRPQKPTVAPRHKQLSLTFGDEEKVNERLVSA